MLSHLSVIRSRGRVRELIPVDDVVYLKSEDKYITIHMRDGRIEFLEDSLLRLEKHLERFVRVHRNCLVSKNCVHEFRNGHAGNTKFSMELVLRPRGDVVKVSRRCGPFVRSLFKNRELAAVLR